MSSTTSPDTALATLAGRALLGDYDTRGAYSARNVAKVLRTDIASKISALEGHPSPSEAPGRGELPSLRATLARADRVLAMLEPLCPAV